VGDGHRVGLSQSYAKNMGLYGQRVGCFSLVCDNPTVSNSQMKLQRSHTPKDPPKARFNRFNYSTAPRTVKYALML
jgi:aspartate aminotransferase